MTDPTTFFTGTLNIPAGFKAGDWVTMPVSGFTYDPTQNLVVEVAQGGGMIGNSILDTNLPTPSASGKVEGPRANTVATEFTGGQSDIRIHLSE